MYSFVRYNSNLTISTVSNSLERENKGSFFCNICLSFFIYADFTTFVKWYYLFSSKPTTHNVSLSLSFLEQHKCKSNHSVCICKQCVIKITDIEGKSNSGKYHQQRSKGRGETGGGEFFFTNVPPPFHRALFLSHFLRSR